jgi:nucleoside-diphosphate-sugar epimerase
MTKVLITGIDGFTGTHLSAVLQSAGFKVFGLSNIINITQDNIYECDLLDKVKLQHVIDEIQPDYVVHLAAISFVGHGNADDFYRINVIGTMNLLDVLSNLDKKPAKVIVASSANVYGTPDIGIIDESVTPSPVNHYATSKLAMEYMTRTLFDDLPIVITRPFNYTGVGQGEQFLIPKIVSHFKRKSRVIELGNINVSRDFSDVRDIASVYHRLLMSDVHSVTVNICRGQAISLSDIIKAMNNFAGYEIEVKVNPEFVRANEINRLQGDNKYLQQLRDFVPAIPIDDTLLWMYGGKE